MATNQPFDPAPRGAGTPVRRERLPALTSLRFAAAAYVVCYHFVPREGLQASASWAERALGAVLSQGYSGVAFFFVLSGFVLTHGYRDRIVHGGVAEGLRFLFARVGRIWPLHAATFLVAVPLALWLDPTGRVHGAARAVGAVANLALVHALLPLRGIAGDFNYVSWTLSAEMLFYVLFPMVMIVLVVVLRPRTWQLFALAAAVSALQLANALAHTSPADVAALDASPLLRLPDFLVGTCLGLAFLNLRERAGAQRGTAAALGAAQRGRGATLAWTAAEVAAPLAVLAAAAATPLLPENLVRGGLYVPLYAAVVWVYAFGNGLLSRPLALRGALTLGEISFGVYMWHALVFRYAAVAGPPVSEGVKVVGAMVFTLLVSYLAWRRIEIPCRTAIVARGERFIARRGLDAETGRPARAVSPVVAPERADERAA